ncbi:hypothetical protein B484DRAFT_423289 [Ochromonadaceae sp. CCMP2298]|nr:hypothetical protein B484DRAFT_423289 [Ochromonadaceae sp. CCMP2298]|mmetsp:Transcript_27364/g.60583  ORF Transcript_27364/g.60583 Transcript_27364/m.60583 type:complete len:164 (+) Transcript_27364:216-707(+)|eukprot:CAMPEP_0173198734 /NCGR_PEP_ID=MMETSP1141-20130122/16845_1 /TAXON_ID=483371 /ORGANISM="non described non described, Strain CCMP2298" /LENGTH=163 /DNA_ID=CAMNT_0014123547 /DNA_START=106 /DNA_END=597 /DNA_ORIENTATION=+
MCGLARKHLQFQKIKAVDLQKIKAVDVIAARRCTACCTCTPEPLTESSSECDCDSGSLAGGDLQLLAADFDLRQVIRSSLRHISFNHLVGVVFIPSITEYKEAGLFDALWWGPADFKRFRQAAASALRKFMRQHKLVDKRYAQRLFILREGEAYVDNSFNLVH